MLRRKRDELTHAQNRAFISAINRKTARMKSKSRTQLPGCLFPTSELRLPGTCPLRYTTFVPKQQILLSFASILLERIKIQ
jgi:hypothetical protein